MKVDVMVCTYNSEWILDKCLESIWQGIPVKTLWVIDKSSQDQTREIAEKHHAVIVDCDGGILEARALGFRTVETDLFVNIDSDVVLPRNWYQKMMRYWENDVACLWGITIEQHPLHRAYVEAMYRIRDPTSYRVTHLPNMIAKKDALADIKFPSKLKSVSFGNDDAWIMHWMRDVKHLRVKTAPIRCKHYSYRLDLKPFWFGAGTRLTGMTKLRSLATRVALSFPQACYAGLVSKTARVVPYWTRFRFQCLIGWLQWNKYLDLKRPPRRRKPNG